MSETPIIPVILSGGSGTRLWPLSTEQRPKQFHALTQDKKSLLQETALRTQILPGATDPLILCNASQVELAVSSQLREIEIAPARILVEPSARNTAPAIAAAAFAALGMAADDDNEALLLVLPADHQIDNWTDWGAAVSRASQVALLGKLVTLGVVPTSPATGYGYIRKGKTHGDWDEVDGFIEKPGLEVAQSLVDSGDYYWNSGMFIFSASQIIAELETYEPSIPATVRRAFDASETNEGVCTLDAEFAESPSISIDYAVMERTDAAAVVALDAGWSDIGSWDAIYELLEKDENGNAISGSAIVIDSRNCLVRAHSRAVGVVGVENLVIVETPDAILVMARDDGQKLRKIVEKLR